MPNKARAMLKFSRYSKWSRLIFIWAGLVSETILRAPTTQDFLQMSAGNNDPKSGTQYPFSWELLLQSSWIWSL